MQEGSFLVHENEWSGAAVDVGSQGTLFLQSERAVDMLGYCLWCVVATMLMILKCLSQRVDDMLLAACES